MNARELGLGMWIDVGIGACLITQIDLAHDHNGQSADIQCAWTPHTDEAGEKAADVTLKLGDLISIGKIELIVRWIKQQIRQEDVIHGGPRSGRFVRSIHLWACDPLLAQLKDDEETGRREHLRKVNPLADKVNKLIDQQMDEDVS